MYAYYIHTVFVRILVWLRQSKSSISPANISQFKHWQAANVDTTRIQQAHPNLSSTTFISQGSVVTVLK